MTQINNDKIIDEDGTIVVKYKYNAWGFVTKNILINLDENFTLFIDQYYGEYYDFSK